MSALPKVSIVMPVYNGGHYFDLAVQSALAQDYPNTEIVIVNDGSNDGGLTATVAERYVRDGGGRVRYFHQENAGVGAALNRGIRSMTGDIFCWLSHDDLFVPDKTSVQVDVWRRLGRADAMLISDYDLIGPDDEHIAHVRFDHEQFRQSPRLPLYRGAVNGCTVFIPRALMSEVRPSLFDETLRYTQDFDFWRVLIGRADFFHVPRTLVKYRIHPTQDSKRPDAADESERLWRSMIDDLDENGRVSLYGSSWRFYDETHRILAGSVNQNAATYLLAKRDACLRETIVSVVIPFFNEVDLVRRAIRSVTVQTHAELQIILVSDGSTDDLADLRADIAKDQRIVLIEQPNGGPAAARNAGLRYVDGDYVAFLDADDTWLPHKVETQLASMAQSGSVFSHTSYLVEFPSHMKTLGLIRSGQLTGNVYPSIIGHCSIACPTIMLHRSLIAQGFQFPVEIGLGEDVFAWIDLAQRYHLHGIDEPLTVVEWSDGSAALNAGKALLGISNQIELLRRHPIHGRFADHITQLAESLSNIGLGVGRHTRDYRLRFWDYEEPFRHPDLPFIRDSLLRVAGDLLADGRSDAASLLQDTALKLAGSGYE